MKNEGDFLLKLKLKNIVYYEKICSLMIYLTENIYPFIQLTDYTNHSAKHSENILYVLEKLIPEAVLNEMNSFELFALIASVLLHDIGMIVTIKAGEDLNSIRLEHAKRSKQLIVEEYENFELDRHQAEIIGVICEAHCEESANYINDSLYSIKGCDNPRVRFIASLLRLGDILDVWSNRTPDIVYRHRIFNNISLEHWNKHQNISNVKIVNLPSWDIVLYVALTSEDDKPIIEKLVTNIERELKVSKDTFRNNGLYYKNIDLVIREKNNYKKKFTNAFKLLAPFTNNDVIRFAGRLHETYKIINLINARKVVLVIGESGVGKTSLINAGVLPKIRKQFNPKFDVINFSFSSLNPVNEIIQALKNLIPKTSYPAKQELDKLCTIEEILNALKSKKILKSQKILFFGDHLEQLFTLNRSYHIFLNQLDSLINSELEIVFLFCIREDYLPQLFNYSIQIPELYNKENTFRLFKFDKQNASEVFRRASEVSNIPLTENFINEIVDDLYIECEGAVFPPYLQIVGFKIYEYLNNESPLDSDFNLLDMFNSLGRSKKIISEYLSGLLDKYKYEEKEYVAQILSTMTTEYYTKKRVSLSFLKETFMHMPDIEKLLNSLISDRIVKRTIDDYELSHDFLALKIVELINIGSFLSSNVRNAIGYIEQNYSNVKLNVKKIAHAVDVTPTHLVNLFNKELGKGIKVYLNNFRLEEVKNMLVNTKKSIKEISLISGFVSQNTLSRNFKKEYNITPSLYRTIQQKKELQS